MELSPELKVMPEVASKFFKCGIGFELIGSLIIGDRNRNMIEDCRRVLNEFKKDDRILLTGLENIKGGALLTFNHPNSDVILPAFLDLIVNIHDRLGRETRLVMATEIPLTAHHNEKKEVPGSIQFLERFHGMYGGGIISTPTIESRKDYLTGRTVALRRVFRELNAGNIIAIAPEGHTEINGEISPIETFHDGSGAISRMAAKHGIPTIPVGLFGIPEKKFIFVNIGKPFIQEATSDNEAVVNIMSRVAELLPPALCGPFST